MHVCEGVAVYACVCEEGGCVCMCVCEEGGCVREMELMYAYASAYLIFVFTCLFVRLYCTYNHTLAHTTTPSLTQPRPSLTQPQHPHAHTHTPACMHVILIHVQSSVSLTHPYRSHHPLSLPIDLALLLPSLLRLSSPPPPHPATVSITCILRIGIILP